MSRRPVPLLRRMAARMGRSLSVWSGLVASSSYGAANFNRLTNDWVRSATSPDKELDGSIRALRARSRDLQRNSPFGAQYIRLLVDNVAGPRGVMFQSKVVNNRGDFDDRTNELVEEKWTAWGRAGSCTVDGRYSWVDVQRLAIGLIHGDGEFLVRLRPGMGEYGLMLDVIDADLLEDDFNQQARSGQNEIRMGVEVNSAGQAVAYHILKRHPNDINNSASPRERVRVPAEEIIHLFLPTRPGQTRGTPGMAPIMYVMRMLQGYQEAAVVAARAAAAKLGVITQDAEVYGPPAGEAPNDGPVTVDAEPGSFYRLLPGENLTAFDPQNPNAQFRDFSKGMLQAIASGLGVSYAALSADLEGTSYASGRTGTLQERDRYRALQAWLIEHLHRRVFREWLRYAVLAGQLPLTSGKRDEVERAAMWQPRGWAWVDPKSDVDASIAAITNGLDSRTRIVAEQGRDIQETLEELAREAELAEEADVDIGGKATPAPPPPAPAEEADDAAEDATEPTEDVEDVADQAATKAAEKMALLLRTLTIAPPPVTMRIERPMPAGYEFVRAEDGRILGAKLLPPVPDA